MENFFFSGTKFSVYCVVFAQICEGGALFFLYVGLGITYKHSKFRAKKLGGKQSNYPTRDADFSIFLSFTVESVQLFSIWARLHKNLEWPWVRLDEAGISVGFLCYMQAAE